MSEQTMTTATDVDNATGEFDDIDAGPTPGTFFDFAASALPEAIKRIDIANRKLAKAGITEQFTYTVEEYLHAKQTDSGISIGERRIKLTLNRPAIAFGGWEFVATLVHETGGIIARTVPGKTLDGWTATDKTCDHCHTNRARKDTFVVRHEETGEIKQIGSNCLPNFLGVSPTGLWSLDWDLDVKDDHEREANPTGGDFRVGVRDLISVALAVSDHGREFTTRKTAEFGGKTATSDLTFNALFGRGGKEDEQQWRRAMVAEAQRIVDEEPELIEELLTIGKNMDGDSEYAANMRVLAASTEIDPRNAALLISVISAWNREQGRIAERKARAVITPGFYAPMGTKITNVPATITYLNVIPGFQNGYTTIITMVTTDTGHEMKWFATGRKDYAIGDEVTILSATVKEKGGHDTYNGTDQTVITRAKMEAR